MKGTQKRPRSVQSVDRAVMILELLAAQPAGLGLGGIAGKLGLAPQTAQSLLRTLEAHEMVVQRERGTPYCLGPRIHRLSRKWMSGRDMTALAGSTVEALSRKIGEYVLLAKLRGGTLVRLGEASPDQALMISPEMALSGDLHTLATGKLLLAYLDDDQREAIIPSLDFKMHGPRSVRDPAELRRLLPKIRRRGWVVCIEEHGAGVTAMAVPVHEAGGRVVAALGTAVPLVRFPKARRAKLRGKLQAAAARIEKQWGM
ncbi:MAG: IclR family transcriptional regulator [Planctomycetes bacterium]|nr:IclR family transcriptional regulator [Planctomycetota bacterium]